MTWPVSDRSPRCTWRDMRPPSAPLQGATPAVPSNLPNNAMIHRWLLAYVRTCLESRWLCHAVGLLPTVTRFGVVKVATSAATPTPWSSDPQLPLGSTRLFCLLSTTLTPYSQRTRRTVIRDDRTVESVQAHIAPCTLALFHRNHSLRCVSQIHTVGIDLGVRYQCCHGCTACRSPHMAHFTTLKIYASCRSRVCRYDAFHIRL